MKDQALGRACARLANREPAVGVLAYSYYASYAFERLRPGVPRIVFQVHPHPEMVKTILEEELLRCPEGRASLLEEHELNVDSGRFNRLANEARDADYVLTPSTFARKSLEAAGICGNRIAVVPYGISTNAFSRKQVRNRDAGPLKVIFVGSLIQRKGLSYLLQAMRKLRGANIRLTLAGRGARDDRLLAAFPDVQYDLLWDASREKLVHEMQQADVFVLPSLVESFAHVILEAMAVGLPIVTTVNTAGPDIVEEGVTGFVGEIRDSGFVATKIAWFDENRDAIPIMASKCQEEAAARTWVRFRKGVRNAIDRFEAQRSGRVG